MSTSPYFAKAFLGTNGRPAASGWLYAYSAGSTVPKAIFADVSNTVPLANPLRLDGNGICPQFFTEAGLYDFKVFEYNFVTPDYPGPSCFTAEDIDGETGGGGSTYVLPIATEMILGGVKPDGETVFVDVDGVLSAPSLPYELPIANAVTLGGVRPDDVTVSVDPETGALSAIQPSPYALPIASADTLGGIKPDGDTIAVNPSTGEASAVPQFYVVPSEFTALPDCTGPLQLFLDSVGDNTVYFKYGTFTFDFISTKANVVCLGDSFLNGTVRFMGKSEIVSTAISASAVVVLNDVLSFSCESIFVDGSKYIGINGLDGLYIDRYTKTVRIGSFAAINCGGQVEFKGGVTVTGDSGKLLKLGSIYVNNCFTHGVQVGTISQDDPTTFAFELIEINDIYVNGCGGPYVGSNKRHGIYLTNSLHTWVGSATVWNQSNGNNIQIGKLTSGNSGRVVFDCVDIDTENYSPSTAIKGGISIADDAPLVQFGRGRIANFKEYGVQIYAGQNIDLGSLVFERPDDASGIPCVVIRGNCGRVDVSRCVFRGWYDTTRRGVSYGVDVGDGPYSATVDYLDMSGTDVYDIMYHALRLGATSTISHLRMVSPKVYRAGGVISIDGTLASGVVSGIYGEALGSISTAWKMPTDKLALTVENNVLNAGGTTVRLNDIQWTRAKNITQFDTTYWIDTSTGIGYAPRDWDSQAPDSALNDGFFGKVFYGGAWLDFGEIVIPPTIRTNTAISPSATKYTIYTGSGLHTEPLPSAINIGAVREYRNSGTSLWTLICDGSDSIDAGNPSSTAVSIALLPGQSARIYVATAGRWEVL